MKAAVCALLSLLVVCPARADWISSIFTSGNEGQGAMFDVESLAGAPLKLTGAFKGNFTTGVSGTVQVWYRAGTYKGHSQDPGGWTLLGTPAAISSPVQNTPTAFNVGDPLLINPGQTIGMFVYYDTELDAGGLRYTDSGYPSFYGDSNLKFTVGIGKAPSAGTPPVSGIDWGDALNPRLWNGSIEYAAATPEPGTLVLMGLACPLAAALRRRRRPRTGIGGR